MGISIVANQSSVHKVLAVIIEFAKRKDGNTVLRCVRDDGSSTWQRNEDQHAGFFPIHDLLHYAVESELGFAQGFFGLIGAGWNMDQTTGKSARGPLPHEALEVEHFVSLFTAEWNSATVWTAAEFAEQATSFARARGWPAPRYLTDEQLTHVRDRFNELVARWRDLPDGETLRLEFPATPRARSSS
ncbi:MAG TPA: hypothetical protein VE086_03400 [Chthoniobacterales bacterium]|nr:hypothetical protein [Chthoniobacterales bacterium]